VLLPPPRGGWCHEPGCLHVSLLLIMGAAAAAAASAAAAALTDAGPCSIVSMVMVNTEWERELSWFIRVAPTERFFLPTCRKRTVL
jgi:hypothetical protein